MILLKNKHIIIMESKQNSVILSQQNPNSINKKYRKEEPKSLINNNHKNNQNIFNNKNNPINCNNKFDKQNQNLKERNGKNNKKIYIMKEDNKQNKYLKREIKINEKFEDKYNEKEIKKNKNRQYQKREIHFYNKDNKGKESHNEKFIIKEKKITDNYRPFYEKKENFINLNKKDDQIKNIPINSNYKYNLNFGNKNNEIDYKKKYFKKNENGNVQNDIRPNEKQNNKINELIQVKTNKEFERKNSNYIGDNIIRNKNSLLYKIDKDNINKNIKKFRSNHSFIISIYKSKNNNDNKFQLANNKDILNKNPSKLNKNINIYINKNKNENLNNINEIGKRNKQQNFFENKNSQEKIYVKSHKNRNNILNDTNNINEYEPKKYLYNAKENKDKKVIDINKKDEFVNGNKDNILENEEKKLKEINILNKSDTHLQNTIIKEDDKKSKINNSVEFEQNKSQENIFENNNYYKKEIQVENKFNYNNKGKEEKKQDNEELIKEKKISKETKKIYGFKSNNCYLNSSLQLLTRIKDLKDKILSFNDICKDSVTKGKLINELRNIFNKIDNDTSEQPTIELENLKNIFGEIDEKYKGNSQEDANEFISHFINALFGETTKKDVEIKKLDINNEMEKKAYDIFYKKFYIKKGYSFIIDLFYGILKTEKYCKNCNKMNSIKFNAYNMLELSIYELVKQNTNVSLNILTILNNYISDFKNDYDNCKFCNQNEIYINNCIYTLPKYLIVFFKRTVGEQYISNNIEYPEKLNFNDLITNKNNKINYSNYILDCVIEHSGGILYGHYTALCPIDENNKCWYRFNDNYCDKNNYGYQSKNAVILLYKSIDI